MSNKQVTFKEARETINHLVQGVDPYTGEVLEEVEFLQNPRMIRCFALMSELLTRTIERTERDGSQKQQRGFCISKEAAASINFPPGDLGVKGVLSAVNNAIDQESVRSLTVVTLYTVLKDHGILTKSSEDRPRTVITDKSGEYGIKSVQSTFQGEVYDRIMYTDQAKVYLKEKLPEWFPVKK